MRVFIATPTAGAIAPMAYSQTLVSATTAIHAAGGSYRFQSVDGANVSLARNLLAHSFLSDSECSHILFIDSDMAISTRVFDQFLREQKPIIGAIYSERRLDLSEYAKSMASGASEPTARAMASKFNLLVDPGEITVTRNLCPVKAFGFGCVLIERAVFAALISRDIVRPLVSSKLDRLGTPGKVWDFFSEISLENGDQLSEDYAFCRRVLQLDDVPLLGYVGGGIGHVGQFTYSAPYIERLKSGQA